MIDSRTSVPIKLPPGLAKALHVMANELAASPSKLAEHAIRAYVGTKGLTMPEHVTRAIDRYLEADRLLIKGVEEDPE